MEIGIFKVGFQGPRGGKKYLYYFIDENNGKIIAKHNKKQEMLDTLCARIPISVVTTYKGTCNPAELAMARTDMIRREKTR